VLLTVLAALAAFATQKLREFINSKVDADQQATIEKAIKGALGFVAEQAKRAGKDTSSPEVRQEMAIMAKEYVKAAVPDTLAKKGQGDVEVTRLVTSRMGGKENVAAVDPAPAQPVPATPEPQQAARMKP
jgi:hypothetical protein